MSLPPRRGSGKSGLIGEGTLFVELGGGPSHTDFSGPIGGVKSLSQTFFFLLVISQKKHCLWFFF